MSVHSSACHAIVNCQALVIVGTPSMNFINGGSQWLHWQLCGQDIDHAWHMAILMDNVMCHASPLLGLEDSFPRQLGVWPSWALCCKSFPGATLIWRELSYPLKGVRPPSLWQPTFYNWSVLDLKTWPTFSNLGAILKGHPSFPAPRRVVSGPY